MRLVGAITTTEIDVMTPTTAGVFFSIYYCMTGIYAIHILAGIGVLVWLLVRAVRLDFNRQYFGPVDYVGLYWHLVDLTDLPVPSALPHPLNPPELVLNMSAHAHSEDDHGSEGHDFAHPMSVQTLLAVFLRDISDRHHSGSGKF